MHLHLKYIFICKFTGLAVGDARLSARHSPALLPPLHSHYPKNDRKKICVKWIEKAFFVNIDKHTFEFLKYSGYAADTKAYNPINW